jgi:hypothetical protein
LVSNVGIQALRKSFAAAEKPFSGLSNLRFATEQGGLPLVGFMDAQAD